MIIAATCGPDETRDLAGALAALVVPGDLVVLAGELGAGKTAFVQGLALSLGVTDPVTSPTFTLANRYEGRVEVNHLDVYRLEQLEEIKELGLHELIDGGGVTLIEWGDAIAPVLGGDYLEIRLTFGVGDDDRRLELVPVGHRWSVRERALTEALTGWLVPAAEVRGEGR
jgi:tRNA threonylcarbamoyladenosine biosynthesis protein TsaE